METNMDTDFLQIKKLNSMIPIPDSDIQLGKGNLASMVEHPLPTYASPGLSKDHVGNKTDNKFEIIANDGKLMYKQFNKTTGLRL